MKDDEYMLGVEMATSIDEALPGLSADERRKVVRDVAATLRPDDGSRLIRVRRDGQNVTASRIDLERSIAAVVALGTVTAFEPLVLVLTLLLLIVGRRNLVRKLTPVDAAIVYAIHVSNSSRVNEESLLSAVGELVPSGSGSPAETRSAIARLHQLGVLTWEPPFVQLSEEVTIDGRTWSHFT